MSSISIIGTGNLARALAGRALAGGNAVEVVGRDPVKAKELAAALGGATVGTAGTAPAGDLVILAVPYASAATVIGEYGDALDGKVIVDITNPITPDFTGFLTPEGSSGAHHAAHFRLQVGDAAVNGIFFVLLDADGKIAEVSMFYRTLPSGVALQRNLADAIGMQPWELHTNEE